MGYESGKVVATITLDTASKKTLTSIEGESINIQTTTLGTVGAGKVWRIVGAQLGAFAGAGTGSAKVLVNGVAVLRCKIAGLAAAFTTSCVSQSWTYENAIVATAGQTVQVLTDANNTQAGATVQYYEEAA